jgi:hypothetical protein
MSLTRDALGHRNVASLQGGGELHHIVPDRKRIAGWQPSRKFGTNTQNGSAAYVAKSWTEQVSFTRDFSSGFIPNRDYRNFAAD